MKHFVIDQVEKFKESWALQDYVIAQHILTSDKLEDVQAGDVVLISLSEEMGSTVRYKWYGYSQITSVRLVDYGQYLNNDLEYIMEVISALWDRGAIVILLSSAIDKGLYHQIHDQYADKIKNSTSITRSPGDTFRLYPETSFVSIANQVHRSTPSHLVKSKNLLSLRLGEMRSYFAESEPYVRHADCCFFDLNSIRYADAPAQRNPSSSGLTSEEACHLAKYAGSASQMKLFWIYNFVSTEDERQVTADLAAQLLWYFLSGMEDNRDSVPVDLSKLQTYIVEFDRLDIPLTFYKSPITDRWWVSGSIDLDPTPLPCSQRDYNIAKKGELSQRLLDLFQVYG